MGRLGFLIETVENSIKDKRVENTPPLNSMTSMALLFNTSVLIEKIVAAPNKHTTARQVRRSADGAPSACDITLALAPQLLWARPEPVRTAV